MPPEAEGDLRLETGHVLFIDLVGYSKLLIEEQRSDFVSSLISCCNANVAGARIHMLQRRWIKSDHLYDSVRDEPRFRALTKEDRRLARGNAVMNPRNEDQITLGGVALPASPK